MERASFSHRTVYIGFASTLVLGFLVALYIFGRYASYEPSALRHIPPDASSVVRINLEQGVVYEPQNAYLVPLFERGRNGPESRLKHLERKTTLELGVDARELVFARFGEGRWLLVLAGLLREEGVIDGVGRLLSDEGVPYRRDGELLVHPSGVTFAVASGGTLLLASDRELALVARQAPGEAPWAPMLRAKGVALALWVAPPGASQADSGSKTAPRLRGGSALVLAEPYFPVRGEFVFSEGTHDLKQIQGALSDQKAHFGAILPLSGFRAGRKEGQAWLAQANLGRERFDALVQAVALQIAAALPPLSNSQK